MRKGAKRKRSQKDNVVEEEAAAKAKASSSTTTTTTTTTQEEQKNHKQKATKKAAPTTTQPKRVKVSKPQPEPEYFEDQRNLDAFEEGGVLHGKKVYLFGSTEPQLVPFKDEQKVICIPVVVAVVSPFPPSDKIGINSVQREAEEIVPMKQMKMDWVPYIPLEKRDSQVDRLKSQIFIMGCTQRKSALRHLKIERVKKYEYCLPYFYNPFKEDELEQSTVVPILFEAEPKPVFCEFDWDMDELEDFVKKKVKEAKSANREAREARKKALEEMSEEVKRAHENMRFYKFYPVQTPDTPDISNVKM
ncbi:conserved hypothetical protein [Ricinus communis]|uniref:Uncharacterized protein n=1 Tax=Ricinus communis TaxID=3988 RepID=B9SRP9_RICCO|nr:conserved hypothetical protein [Ricinus communis]